MNTMDSTQIIMTYKAILTTTGKMLTAAQNNEWDQLVSLEQECRRLTETLKKNDKEQLKKKVTIIHQILEDDAQIRALIQPWMVKLQDILNTNSRTRNLQQAYQLPNNV